MKTFKIFALLLALGLSQAGATGFAYNMNIAQKMLKEKKEVVKTREVSTSKERSEPEKPESRKVLSMEKETEFSEIDETTISERVVSTFIQWLSQALIKFLTLGR